MNESTTTTIKYFKFFGIKIWEIKETYESDSILEDEEFKEEMIKKITPKIKEKVSEQIVKEIQSTLSQ